MDKNWRDEYKAIEQAFMCLKDDYCELARALGFKGDPFWGDTFVPHAEILAKVKELTDGS